MTLSVPELRPPAAGLPEELRGCAAFLLARVGSAIKQAAVDEFEREGFSAYQYSVLAVLGEGVKETQATIADALRIDRGQLVGVLDELEKAGLVERRRDQSDRRRHTVSLTKAGRKELVKLRAIVKRIEDGFLEPLDEHARTTLRDALLRVVTHHEARVDQQ
jgi:DNA-binding MarR family transcriptional regulator